jgi:hypothetical protein
MATTYGRGQRFGVNPSGNPEPALYNDPILAPLSGAGVFNAALRENP